MRTIDILTAIFDNMADDIWQSSTHLPASSAGGDKPELSILPDEPVSGVHR